MPEHRVSTGQYGYDTFYHLDSLGSTRLLSNDVQTVTDEFLYDAFGNVLARSGATPTPSLWGGAHAYQSDYESGLILMGNRYYDPSIGRFISQDPAQDESNWYAYCGNNPLVAVDPSGLTKTPFVDPNGVIESRIYTQLVDAAQNQDWAGFNELLGQVATDSGKTKEELFTSAYSAAVKGGQVAYSEMNNRGVGECHIVAGRIQGVLAVYGLQSKVVEFQSDGGQVLHSASGQQVANKGVHDAVVTRDGRHWDAFVRGKQRSEYLKSFSGHKLTESGKHTLWFKVKQFFGSILF